MKKFLPIILAVVITAAASSGITYFVTVNSIESAGGEASVSENGENGGSKGNGGAAGIDTQANISADGTGYELKGGNETRSGSSAEDDVQIKSARIVKNYDNLDTVVITYEYSRLSGDPESFWNAFDDAVYQNGSSLERTYSLLSGETENAVNYDINSYDSDVKAGYTNTVTVAYILKNKTDDLVVEVNSYKYSNYDLFVSRTFTME